MNELSKITERIQTDAVSQAQRIKEEAEETCRRIRSDAEQAARERYWKVVGRGTVHHEQQAKLKMDGAAMENRRRVLAKKQEMVAQAFQKAGEALQNLPPERYAVFLVALMVKAAETGRERVILSERDRAQYGEICVAEANRILRELGRNGSLALSEETADMDGGVILDGGRVRITASLDHLLQQCRRDLSIQVAEILFD